MAEKESSISIGAFETTLDTEETTRLIRSNAQSEGSATTFDEAKKGEKPLASTLPIMDSELYKKYEASILAVLGASSFVKGADKLVNLATQTLFKHQFKMQPSESQRIEAALQIPWSLKIFYGLISDNVPIWGSRRKSYLLIFSSIMFLAMLLMGTHGIHEQAAAVWYLGIFQLGLAFIDLIREAVMVSQARKDPSQGAEELQSFSWTALGFGGLSGSILAAFLTEAEDLRYCFFAAGALLSILFIASLRMSTQAEVEERTTQSEGLWADLKHNLGEIVEALRLREFRNVVIFIFVTGLVVPTFDSFEYFFLIDEIGLSMFAYSMLTVLGYFALLVGTQLYSQYFKEFEYRSMIAIDLTIQALVMPVKYILMTRINLTWGIPDLALIVFSTSVTKTLQYCLIFLPITVLMAKLCPKRIEATSFALLAGTYNIRDVVQGWLGSFINDTFVGVTKDDLSKYWILITIALACSFLQLAFVWLLPTRQEIKQLATTIRDSDSLAERDSGHAQNNGEDDQENLDVDQPRQRQPGAAPNQELVY